ncbi:hypothetical protein M5689_019131 [Euphorbia peplus]|nr:hypothetical protein M5689_019131 [Euphorbia peplus]
MSFEGRVLVLVRRERERERDLELEILSTMMTTLIWPMRKGGNGEAGVEIDGEYVEAEGSGREVRSMEVTREKKWLWEMMKEEGKKYEGPKLGRR